MIKQHFLRFTLLGRLFLLETRVNLGTLDNPEELGFLSSSFLGTPAWMRALGVWALRPNLRGGRGWWDLWPSCWKVLLTGVMSRPERSRRLVKVAGVGLRVSGTGGLVFGSLNE